MDVVFLDANVLFSAAYRSKSGLKRLWELDGLEIITSGYAVEEARRNLSEPSQRERLDQLLRGTRLVSESSASEYEGGDITESPLPAKDLPILAAAIGARATHLLTGDVQHFGSLFGRTIGGMTILTPSQYIAGLLGRTRDPE